MKEFWEAFLIWLKGVFDVQSNEDLLKKLISKMVTDEVLEVVIPVIIEVSKQELSGEEKKRLVAKRALEAGKLINNNAINLIVEFLKQQGKIPRSYEQRAKSFKHYELGRYVK